MLEQLVKQRRRRGNDGEYLFPELDDSRVENRTSGQRDREKLFHRRVSFSRCSARYSCPILTVKGSMDTPVSVRIRTPDA